MHLTIEGTGFPFTVIDQEEDRERIVIGEEGITKLATKLGQTTSKVTYSFRSLMILS